MARTGVFVMALATLIARAAAQDSPCGTSAPVVATPAPAPPPTPPPPAPAPAHPFYGYGGICVEGYSANCNDKYPAALPTDVPTTTPPETTTAARPLHYYYIGRGFCADEFKSVFDAWALNNKFTVNDCEDMCDASGPCIGFDTTTQGLCILRYDAEEMPSQQPNDIGPWKDWRNPKGSGEGKIHTVHPDTHFACYSKFPRVTTTPEAASTSTSFGQAPPIPEFTPSPGPSSLPPYTPHPDCKVEPDPECVFPFKYKGVTYEECTTVDKDNGQPWCSTDEVYDKGWRDCKTDCAKKENIGAIIGGTVGGAAAITGIGLIAGAATGNLGNGPQSGVGPAFKAAAPVPGVGPAFTAPGAYPAPTQVISAPVAVGAVKLYSKEGDIEGTQVSKYGSVLTAVAGLTAITLLASGVVYAVRRHARQQSRVINNEEDLEQSAVSDGDMDSGNAPLITSPIPMVETSPAE